MTVSKVNAALSTAVLLLACMALPMTARGQVYAELVAADESARPGHPITLAVRMEHDPGWHTYWVNAGIGAPTTIKWALPDGWKAGAINWPTPRAISDSSGTVTGQGYSDLLLLPVDLTVPASAIAGESVTLRAHAAWVMCAEICIPKKQDLSLSLPVSTASPKPNRGIRAQLADMPMPAAADRWKVGASGDGTSVVLQLVAPDAVKDPRFFSEDPFIFYDRPQQVAGDSGQLALTLARDPDAVAPSRLKGILAFTDSTGRYRGVSIDTALNLAVAEPALTAATAVAGSAGSTSSMPLILVLGLLGGLILNLMPCVFPVLGIKVLGFLEQSGNDRRRVTVHGLVFTAGVLVSFWALAGLLSFLRAGGAKLGWGFQLQSAPFVFALTVIMLVFALSLSGVFEFGLRATGVGSGLQMKSGYGGSFFTGVLATVVATPCSAPFLAPALGAALAFPTSASFMVFTAIAIGLAAPYLLLSAFPQAVRLLPRPGRWMETFKQVMAFPLYATAGYLVWVLAGQTSESGLLAVLFSLTVIAMAVWLYGRYSGLNASARRSQVVVATAFALLVAGIYVGWPRVTQATELTWEPWSSERVAELQLERRPIYVDFTARWCATCQTNKKLVFGSNKVKDEIAKRRIALLKADWTNTDPRITAELAKWGRSAVPFNLVYLPGESQPRILPELLTPAIVLDALSSAHPTTSTSASPDLQHLAARRRQLHAAS